MDLSRPGGPEDQSGTAGRRGDLSGRVGAAPRAPGRRRRRRIVEEGGEPRAGFADGGRRDRGRAQDLGLGDVGGE